MDICNNKEISLGDAGSVCWEGPANIALIKYWGKHGEQLPCNPSVSFTLSEAKTISQVDWTWEETPSLDFYFDGQKREDFERRLSNYFRSIAPYFPFLNHLKLVIHSRNTFPHAAGIASSASSLSSVALSICSIEKMFFAKKDDFWQRASWLARLGSGSAGRSIYGGVVAWGNYKEQFSDQYASPVEQVAPIFLDYCDSILIVDSSEKMVSSSRGHALMHSHPLKESRFIWARKNFELILQALSQGDLKLFGQVLEVEALGLHAMMMTSAEAYLLLKPNTLVLIEKIRKFRQQSGLPVYFTLDAGPNIHLLYPQNIKDQVQQFIGNDLSTYLENGKWLDDRIGLGPKQLQ